MKRKALITFVVLAAGLGMTISTAIQRSLAQDDNGRVPPEVVVLGEKAKLGKITFHHSDHISKNYNLEGTGPIACIKCHHVEQPATAVADDPVHKTVYPADRTATLTAESIKDPKTPAVTKCHQCHIRKGEEPKLLTEVPTITDEKKGKTVKLDNRNAFHRRCTTCHNEVSKARPEVKAPKSMKCFACHKKS